MTLSLSLAKPRLCEYVNRQLAHFFPDDETLDAIATVLDEGLTRLETCINASRMWRAGHFDHLHSSQYSIFLYHLARVAYENELPLSICDKLFYLNKVLNGIDLFYEIEMPRVFFIGHTSGIVVCKATYGENLVLYQNCTIGKSNGKAPRLGDNVIMFAGSAVYGDSRIASGSVISQGTKIRDTHTQAECLVFNGGDSKGEIVCKQTAKSYINEFFRSEEEICRELSMLQGSRGITRER